MGHRDAGNEIFIKDPSLLKAEARSYADLPGGHSEGYDDTFKHCSAASMLRSARLRAQPNTRSSSTDCGN